MRPVGLYDEMLSAAYAVRQLHLDALWAIGVEKAVIANMGRESFSFGVTHAEAVGGGLYQPGGGAPHFVLPVLEDGELIDLCAFRLGSPDAYRTRIGQGWLLGLQHGLDAYPWDEPLLVFNNPRDWLRAGGRGICVLDWSSHQLRQLAEFREVAVSDAATAALLRAALIRLPRIRLREVANAAQPGFCPA